MFCKKCNKTLYDKHVFKKHLETVHNMNNESEIDKKINETDEIGKRFKCTKCSKEYSRNFYLKKHKCITEKIKTFIDNTQLDETYKEILIDTLENSIITNNGNNNISNSNSDHNITTNNNNNNITTNNNITINNPINSPTNNMKINIMNIGEENTEPLYEDEFVIRMIKIFDNKNYSQKNIDTFIIEIFKALHCNKNYPENYNVYALNKNPYKPFLLFINGKWEKTDDFKEMVKVLKNGFDDMMDTYENGEKANEECEISEVIREQINILKKRKDLDVTSEPKNAKRLAHEGLNVVNKYKNEIGKRFLLHNKPHMSEYIKKRK